MNNKSEHFVQCQEWKVDEWEWSGRLEMWLGVVGAESGGLWVAGGGGSARNCLD